MHILFFADNFPPERNAQASRIFERACYWVNWGHRVTVVTCAPNFPEGKVHAGYRNRFYQVENLSGIRVVRVKTFIAENRGKIRRSLDYFSYTLPAFIAGMVQPRPDVVAANSPHLFVPLAGMAVARARRLPFVMEVADLWPECIATVGAMKRGLLLRLLEKMELFLYRQASVVATLTQAFKENLTRRGVPPAKIRVVMNGVDLARFSPKSRNQELASEWGIAPGDFVVSYIGTLGLCHGLENVLDCAAMVENPRIRFLLVGPGAERDKLIAGVARRNLRNVTIVPAQPKERMPDFWSLSNLALVHLRNSPLFRTVLPSKMFEAMGMGLPILLVAPDGEASKLLLDDHAGVWVPSGDPRAFANAVSRLAAQPQLCAQLAADSREAAPRHSRERQAQEMLACLEAALAARTRSAFVKMQPAKPPRPAGEPVMATKVEVPLERPQAAEARASD
jgi:colanic acid biosynthesis glycosyl transferase WcaI